MEQTRVSTTSSKVRPAAILGLRLQKIQFRQSEQLQHLSVTSWLSRIDYNKKCWHVLAIPAKKNLRKMSQKGRLNNRYKM